MATRNHKIKNLVFSGGGVKVVSYAGAIKALEEADVMNVIQKVGGTSGGAISALCVSLGYNAKELEDILLKLDFNKFLDDNRSDTIFTKWWHMVWNIVWNYGINSGEYFETFLTKLITDKGFDKDITFKQLHDNSVTKIDLYVVSTNLNRQFAEVSSYETTPETSVLEAVHASGAIPIYFQPVVKKHNHEVCVDGGIFNNYPIELFDGTRDSKMDSYYLTITKNSNSKNISTLGFTTINKQMLSDYQHGEVPKPCMKTDNIMDIISATIQAILNADSYRSFANNDRTVFLDDLNIFTTNFDITDKQKKDLIDCAHNTTQEFLSHYSNNTDYNLETSLIGDVITAEAA